MSKLATHHWRPIKTAPRDGTTVDVYTPFGRIANAVFINNCWRYVYFGRLSYVPVGVKVTHWMPLPEPPERKVPSE